MVMRYLGGGVGHQAIYDRVPIVQADDPVAEGDGSIREDGDGAEVASDVGPTEAADVDEQLGGEGDDDIERDRVASDTDGGSDMSADEDEDDEDDEFFDPEDGEGAGESLLDKEGYSDL
jgi:hypothetical protein